MKWSLIEPPKWVALGDEQASVGDYRPQQTPITASLSAHRKAELTPEIADTENRSFLSWVDGLTAIIWLGQRMDVACVPKDEKPFSDIW